MIKMIERIMCKIMYHQIRRVDDQYIRYARVGRKMMF